MTPGSKSTEDLVQMLKRILPDADPDGLQRLVAASRLARHPNRSTLFFKGDTSSESYLLVSGRVYIYGDAASGQRIILNVITPGQLFGEVAMVDGGARSAHAETAQVSETLVLSKLEFQNLMQENPAVRTGVMQLVTQKLRATTEQMHDAGLFDVEQRLARLFVRLLEQSDRETAFVLQLSQSDLAALVATSRETVNRRLKSWKQRGILSIDETDVQVHDEARLREIAEVEYG